jgi:hypothetical protein
MKISSSFFQRFTLAILFVLAQSFYMKAENFRPPSLKEHLRTIGGNLQKFSLDPPFLDDRFQVNFDGCYISEGKDSDTTTKSCLIKP